MDAANGTFRTPKEALFFALNFGKQAHHPLSALSRLMRDQPLGKGVGLVGLDGAAQAGFIMAHLARLDQQNHYGACALVARCTHPRRACDCGQPCCSKSRPSEVWCEAVAELDAFACQQLGTGLSNRRLRRSIVEKHFGLDVSVEKIAHDCGIHRATASRHAGAIRKGLRELEARAWEAWDISIAEAGMLLEAA
ncbi:DNA-binding protein [Ralstonia chuxiongensis]|uniref:DNA-binding protein n=1 Tax=Ralstonia chuxiongensis TaxID=2957504 RepID=UPI0028F5F1EF|nr:DNA-binding protein [Ralstonia chuxiongensis]CAJ0781882.1 hypothetical protein R8510_04932 [Ralstonia chuxiongensis]